MRNPFQYSGIAMKEAYLERPQVESELRAFFQSGQNLLVQGPRRMGKTSVITHTFRKLQTQRKCYFLHIDLYGVNSIKDVRDKINLALERLPLAGKIRKRLESDLPRLTGLKAFGIGLTWSGEQREKLLEEILALVATINESRPVVVFFDEFQSILDLPEAHSLLARMRSEIQKQPGVFYLFAGSDQARLREMFFVEKSPFLKSAAVMEIGPIPREAFIPWLEGHFKQGKRTINSSIWGPLFDLVYDVPGDVQQFCNVLWTISEPGENIDPVACEAAAEYIINMQEKTFTDFWNILADNQRRLLRGLAFHPEWSHGSADFLKASGISSSAASSKAMEAMLTKGALWHIGSRIAFTNPFLKLWILNRQSN